MFILSQLLSFLLSPLFWIVLLLLKGVLSKKPALKSKSLLWAFILLLVFSNDYLYRSMRGKWEQPAIDTAQLNQRFDYGYVFAKEMIYQPKKALFSLGENASAVLKMMELQENRVVKEFLISGKTTRLFSDTLSNAEKLQAFLLSADVSRRKITLETEARTIYESAVNTKALLDSIDSNYRILIIAPALEAKRAYETFYNQRIEVMVYPIEHQGVAEAKKLYQAIIPQPTALTGWYQLIREWFTYYAYSIKNYL